VSLVVSLRLLQRESQVIVLNQVSIVQNWNTFHFGVKQSPQNSDQLAPWIFPLDS
jgi:hypothetical protein